MEYYTAYSNESEEATDTHPNMKESYNFKWKKVTKENCFVSWDCLCSLGHVTENSFGS